MDFSQAVQFGGIGIAALSLWVVYKLMTNHDEHMRSTIDRNTDAWIENTKALTNLSSIIERRKDL